MKINNKTEKRRTKRKQKRRKLIKKKKTSVRRNNFNSIWGTFWSRNRSSWLSSKQKLNRCEPQDTLRCSNSPGSQRGDLLAPWSSRVGTGCTETTVLGVKWVAVAPFELKLGPNESSGRAASVKPPLRPKKAQLRAKIIVKLQGSAAWGASHLNNSAMNTACRQNQNPLGWLAHNTQYH